MIIRHWLVIAYLLTMAGCATTNPRVVTRLNGGAALNGDLPLNPLRWQVITSGVDPRNATMFTLFGNDAAVRHARSSADTEYPESSVLALATWEQQEDSRWFGARIPARPMSVEFVDVRAAASGRRQSSIEATMAFL